MIYAMLPQFLGEKKLNILRNRLNRKTQLITFFLLLTLISVHSQDCECPEGGITIGNPDIPNGVTSLSQTELPSQTYTGCLKIYGTLVITSHYSFDQCQIFMETGSQILVNPTKKVKIDSSTVTGCSTMWRGIYLRNNARLNMNNTTIKDAQYAIYAENYTYLNLIDNIFDANYVGLYVPEKPGYSSNKIHFENDDIDGNLFTLRSPYKPAFIGQIPLPGESPYAGIHIKDTKHITIGKPSNPDVPVKNYFEYMRFGVIFEDCLYTGFYGGQFSQFQYDEHQPFLLGGTAIDLKGNDRLEIRYCDIKGARTGIFCTQNDQIKIKNNDIISEDIGIYILAAEKTTIVQKNNIISTQNDCIVVGIGDSQHPVQIKENTLTSYLTAIHLDFFDGVLEVEDNFIHFVHTDNVFQRHGIVATGLAGPTTIKGNNFIALDTVATNVKQAIILNLCENTLVKENFISGAMNEESSWYGGISSNFSPNNNYCCNTINNTNYGVFFTGVCTDTKLASTTFGGKQTVALFLVNSEISPQENNGNDWSQIENYSTGFSADAWYNGDPNLMGNSKLTVFSEMMPNAYDMVVVPSGEMVENWVEFSGQDSLCEEQVKCADDAIKLMVVDNSGGISTQLAEALIPHKTNDITVQIFHWEKQKNLYKALYQQPEIRNSNADFLQFFNKHKNGLIGQFHEIEKSIYSFSNGEFDSEIDYLIEENAKIKAETKFQENEKAFNDLYLNTLVKGIYQLNHKQKLALQTLIHSHPQTNGTAVWKAQSLTTLLNLEMDYSNFELATTPPSSSDSKPDFNENSVEIFPNPASDLVNVKISQNDEFATSLTVFDNTGKAVLMENSISQKADFQLNTSNLLSGFYVVEIEWESGLIAQKRLMIIQ